MPSRIRRGTQRLFVILALLLLLAGGGRSELSPAEMTSRPGHRARDRHALLTTAATVFLCRFCITGISSLSNNLPG
jgi:hypothetical protein